MAIHHSAARWIGVTAEDCRSGIAQWRTDFADEGLAILGGDDKWGALSGKNRAGADWFRHSCSLVFAYGSLKKCDVRFTQPCYQ